MSSILLVEDDNSLGLTLRERLQTEGYQVSWARNLSEARTLLSHGSWDLFILDIGLPDGSGLDLGAEVRRQSRSPILFLTADNSIESRLQGFELGADDYIPKPFHLKELLLRASKALGRGKAQNVISAGEVSLNLDALSISFSDGRQEYPIQRDFELLRYLVQASPRVISRDEVIREIFKAEKDITPRTVDNSVMRLRAHLAEFGERYIRSVRGVGYQWIV